MITAYAAPSPPVDPWRVSVDVPSGPNSYVGSGFSIAVVAGAINATQLYNSGGLINDSFTYIVGLTPGTWKMTWCGLVGNNAAIATVDISYDGGATWTVLGTFDQYAAATAAMAIQSYNGIVVNKRVNALVRFSALAKNATSTQYFMLLSEIGFVRTA